ncbi:hypothetical protein CEXT_30801 [Caerostris extrusa]|uniref:Uncharacterized protein n=1 Tax=Caerostris extrusa TaxID=172846 RepID=A0AAV4WNX0_CAEEX|nr:hypothetical protein CEXT_30801 [Caerostris extrusa]
MRSCLSHLDESDLKEVFEKKRDAYEFIKKFLNWPFQTSFIPVVNQLWSYLSNRDINELLLLITFQIRQGLGDFNYVDLLEEFWDQCPAHLKEGIQKPLLN